MKQRLAEGDGPATRRQCLKCFGGALLLPWAPGFAKAPATSQSSAPAKEPQVPLQEVREIGSRWELFVDDWLIENRKGVDLLLHHPIPQEVAVVFDKPWEGNGSAYVTVFQDGELFRMYYRGASGSYETKKVPHQVTCYAESRDGIQWSKPDLNLFEFEGSTRNNIVWWGEGTHNFTPFKDSNPECKPEARYKAIGGEKGLYAFMSPDGIHWSLMHPEPVITKGAFDSQNLAYWDAVSGHYVEFHRGFRNNVRDILTCKSKDCLHWTEPEWLDYGSAPPEHLYTNAITPYFRAPHLLLGFPMRFLPSRKKIADHPESGISDGVFMTSRDCIHWHRCLEAFIPPGPQQERWWQRNNMTAWGILVTKSRMLGVPDELSLYSSEAFDSHRHDGSGRLRRFTLRLDGFVSAYAPFAGGELVTRPLVIDSSSPPGAWSGRQLLLNYATSAAGSIRVELMNRPGKPIAGFELNSCPEIYGDEVEKAIDWDLSGIAGPVRLRFVLKDAHLYSFRFRG